MKLQELICYLLVLFVVSVPEVYSQSLLRPKHPDPDLPTAACCDGCACIDGTCPSLYEAYGNDLIEYVKDLKLVDGKDSLVDDEGKPYENLYTLECDPYETVSERDNWLPSKKNKCKLEGELKFTKCDDDDYDELVCGITRDCTAGTYTYKTYDNAGKADKEGATVTHRGPCGACSTAQDLAAYMKGTSGKDLTAIGTECGLLGILSFDKAVNCFMKKAGFTKTCAKVWAYNAQQDQRECITTCFLSFAFNEPRFRQPPQCELNSCLACDIKVAEPTFKCFAGRTRSNSGIISELPRKCSDISFDVSPYNIPLLCPADSFLKINGICDPLGKRDEASDQIVSSSTESSSSLPSSMPSGMPSSLPSGMPSIMDSEIPDSRV